MNTQPQQQGIRSTSSTTSADPVCGMDVKSSDASAKQATFRGQQYRFCGDECRQKFEANPEQYLKQNA